ncbi:hypothetical protein EVAR_65938_1 [Eumeta japonica]|uniref:Uncharacterized protein n=1 Tax=Eumeta variegata TaxID=151549 RepID=A0A4C2AEW1_EUMVA|nr:hypothetical protein EVAR_65938_1 [Eumeta japonica]
MEVIDLLSEYSNRLPVLRGARHSGASPMTNSHLGDSARPEAAMGRGARPNKAGRRGRARAGGARSERPTSHAGPGQAQRPLPAAELRCARGDRVTRPATTRPGYRPDLERPSPPPFPHTIRCSF